jgi:Mismatch repair ATPase (MutS family)
MFQSKIERRLRANFGKIPSKKSLDLDDIAVYHELNPVGIDDITWNDLDMDSVFHRINACLSSVGEEYLYHVLHDLKTDSSDIEKRETLISWFDKNPNDRVKIQKILHGLGKVRGNGVSMFLSHAESGKLRHTWIYVVLALFPIIGALSIPIFGTSGIMTLFFSILFNTYLNTRIRKRIDHNVDTIQYISALIHCAKTLDKKHGALLNFTEVLKPLRKIGGLVSGSIQRITSDLDTLAVIFKTIFYVDIIMYNRNVKKIIRHKDELFQLYKVIGELEVALCVNSYRHSLDLYCIPEFHCDNAVNFRDAYHPLLSDPIPNSGDITNDSIITGSNASGKSTFIKMIAINHILAQTINTCCAESYKLSYAYVASSMALRDNITSGDSYFVTEIKSLKRIIEYCKEQRCICFVDEILRGTNTKERIAASTAVLNLLHEMDGLCLVASHDIELIEILDGVYDNYHFSEKFENNMIEFDYLLKNGASRSTNAIKLLEYMGFDQRIIDEAMRMI